VTLASRRSGCRLAGLLLVVLVLGGCDRASADGQLRRAAEETLAMDVAFTSSVTAARPPGSAPDDPAAQAAASLAAVEVAGARRSAGPYALAVGIGGTEPLFEVRGGGGQPLLLRTGLGGLLGAEGDPEDVLGPRLDELGIEGEQRGAVIAGFAGEWIAIVDATGLGDLADGAPDAEPGDPFDLARLFAALEATAARDVGEVRRLDVVLDADAWLGSALGGALVEDAGTSAGRLPGTVTLRDGAVHEVRVELPGDEAGGPSELVLALHDHGEVTFPDPVTPVAEVTAAELAALVEALGDPLG
jgi:hypothetical protein